MRRPPIALLPLAALTLACASGSRNQPATDHATTTTRVVGSDGNQRSIVGVLRTEPVKSQIFAPPQQTWDTLVEVYQALGIEIVTLLQDEKRIGNDAFRARRKIADMPMQRLLDCGGPSGSPNAETYDVTMAISTTVGGSGEESTLATTISANARSASFAGAPVNCTSTGRLERRIDELVKARLALAK